VKSVAHLWRLYNGTVIRYPQVTCMWPPHVQNDQQLLLGCTRAGCSGLFRAFSGGGLLALPQIFQGTGPAGTAGHAVSGPCRVWLLVLHPPPRLAVRQPDTGSECCGGSTSSAAGCLGCCDCIADRSMLLPVLLLAFFTAVPGSTAASTHTTAAFDQLLL